ncbi:MAG: bifunctional metallophosphatase/5'-nucleotidase [Deltaproteobacteria bacterium]|nr:bifunctional metallophosphatase/5'-nucleotidase [Deltaproteobacteria bacterium]
MKVLRFHFFLLPFLLVSCSINKSSAPDTTEISVFHINDFHAQYQPLDENGKLCTPSDSKNGPACYGGAVAMIEAVKERRDKNSEAIFLDAGDHSQGSLLFTVYQDEIASWLNNQLKHDALTFGNHEFDKGLPYVSKLVTKVNSPYLSANADWSKISDIKENIKPYLIIEREGKKIAIIGGITEDAKDLVFNVDDLTFLPLATNVQKYIDELEAQGIKIIILLTHNGLADDRQLAQKLHGADIIVGGHSHSVLSNQLKEAEGPYPIFETAADGKKVAIVTAGSRGKYLGHLLASFNNNGDLLNARGDLDPVNANNVKNEEAQNALIDWLSSLDSYFKKNIGKANVDLTIANELCRFNECAFGNLLTDAMLWTFRNQKPDFAILNGGAMRASIPAGDITLGQVFEALPFGNDTAVFKLKGSDVRKMLEHGLSCATDRQASGTGRFLQVAGLKYNWSNKEAVGKRIKSVEVLNAKGKFENLNPEKIYSIIAPSFLLRGGDGYSVVKEKGVVTNQYGPLLTDLLVWYLAEHPQVSPKVEGRIVESK